MNDGMEWNILCLGFLFLFFPVFPFIGKGCVGTLLIASNEKVVDAILF